MEELDDPTRPVPMTCGGVEESLSNLVHPEVGVLRVPAAVLDGPVDRLALISGLYDRYGTANLFHLAYALCGDIDMAGSLVVHAFAAIGADPRYQDQGRSSARDLARLTYLACMARLDFRPDSGGPFKAGPGQSTQCRPAPGSAPRTSTTEPFSP